MQPCEWRPIEDAPKNGRFLILSRDGYIGIALVQPWEFDDATGVSEYAAWIGQKPYESRASLWMGGDKPSEATHWMPLPDPPS